LFTKSAQFTLVN